MTKLPKKTIQKLLENSFNLYPERNALAFVGEKPITYSQLRNEIEKVKMLLHKSGIKKGDKVGLLSTNMPNWGIAFFAIANFGAIAVPVLPDFHDNEIKNIIIHSEAKLLIVSEKLFPKVKSLETELLKTKVLLDNFRIIPKEATAEDLKNLKELSVADIELENVDIEEDDLLSILYTSGTTGKSKGVMLSHKNIVSNAQNIITVQYIDKEDSFVSILPLAHTYENTLGLILPIMQGASVYYLKKPPTANVLLPALEEIRPTFMLSVPLVIEKIFKKKILTTFTKNIAIKTLYSFPPIRKILHKIAGKKLYETFGGRLKFFGIGGAKVDKTVERFLREAKFPYAIGYGLTETAPMLAGSNPQQTKLQGVGPVMQGIEIKIEPQEKGSKLGEVLAKGENIMRGYFKEPELTKNVFTKDGWFKTGDLGYLTKENFLYLKGRIKNMIVGPSGENIYPEEIESVINNFNFVLESVVVEKKGKLVAHIHFNYEELEKQFKEMKEDAMKQMEEKINNLKQEVQLYVNSRVNNFSRVYAIVEQRTPFEKTATQKIKRYLYH
ncbi:MAG: AMP-binding protein [Bacteroidota bacterium]|nr:AMP-binding protein [Bacteroidota bacterium]